MATTTTDLATIIEKRVSTQITETLHQNAVALGAVRDFSSQVGPGMDRLDIPLYVNPVVGNVDESTGVADNAIGVGTALLALDQHRGIGTDISMKASVQQKIDSVQEWIKNGTFEMASDIDNFLLGLVAAAAPVSALTPGDALEDLAEAKRILDSANVPKADRFIIASPEFMKEVLTTNNIIRANEYASSAPIQAGFVTNIYGFTMLESTSALIVGSGFQAFHRSSVAFARQIMPKLLREERALLVREEYSLTHLYGGVVTDATRMVQFQ